MANLNQCSAGERERERERERDCASINMKIPVNCTGLEWWLEQDCLDSSLGRAPD